MSSYSDLAQAIIQKNGQGGKFSGLNTALDLRQAFKDASTQYAYQSQLAKEQGYNTGVAGIINSANLYGSDPSLAIQQYREAVNSGVNGPLPTTNPNNTGASALATGTTPDTTDFNKSVSGDPNNPNKIVLTASPKTEESNRDEAYLASIAKYNPGRAATIKRYADYNADPTKLGGRFGQALQDQVSRYDSTFNSATYKERQQFITGVWDKGELSKDRKAIENLTQHSAKLSDAFALLDNGNLLIANAGTNELKRQTGNAQVVKAAQLERVAGVEMAKTLSTAGVLTDDATKQYTRDLQNAASPDQMNTLIHGMMVIAQPRINTTLERYKERMGKYPKNGFTPEAINAIKKIAPDVYNELAPKLGLQAVADTSNQETPQNNQVSGVTPQDAIAELKRRGKL